MRLVEFGSVAGSNTIKVGRSGRADDVDPTLVCGNLLCNFTSAHNHTTPFETGNTQALVRQPTPAMLCSGHDDDLLARNFC
jgi:hypothetical protein